MNLNEFRIKYPQYSDLDDNSLSQSLHKKFYSDIPVAEFQSKLGASVHPQQQLDTLPETKEALQVSTPPDGAISHKISKGFTSPSLKLFAKPIPTPEEEALEAPMVDPVPAAITAGTMGGALAYRELGRQGMKTLPRLLGSFKHGAISATVGGVSDIVTGQMADEIGEVAPSLRYPSALLLGILAGGIEAKVAKGVKPPKLGKPKPKDIVEFFDVEKSKGRLPDHHPLASKASEPFELKPQKLKPDQPETFKGSEIMKTGNKPIIAEEPEQFFRPLDTTEQLNPPKPKIKQKIQGGDSSKDSLAAFVRKEGGLDYNREHMKGELDRVSNKEGMTSGIIRKKPGGKTIDEMLERAREDGYFEEYSGPREFMEALEEDLGGNRIWSSNKTWTDKELAKFEIEEMFSIGGMGKKLKSKIGEFFKPESGMKGGEEFLKLRQKAQGFLHRSENFIEKTVGKMKDWTPDTKLASFSYLDGQITHAELATKYGNEVANISRQVRKQLDSVGQMLVRRKMMTPETYNKHKGKYIKYLYTKHIVGEGAERDLVKPSRGLNLKHQKQRKGLSPEKQKAYGFLEDPEISARVALGQELKDIGTYDYLSEMAKNPNWVHPNSFVKVKGVSGKGSTKWTQGKLVDEIDLYKRMVQAQPENAGVKSRLASLQGSYDDFVSAGGKDIPKDFRLLKGRKYGPLDGAFVHKVIERDLDPFYSVSAGAGSKLVSKLSTINKVGMSVFKVAKVALNPPTMARNVVSGMWQQVMGGMPVHKLPGYYMSALKEMKNGGKDYIKTMRQGMFKSNFAVGEIEEIMTTLKDLPDGSNMAAILEKFMGLGKFYGKIDDVAKLAMFKHQKSLGLDDAESARIAIKWGMDYSFVHPAVRQARQKVIPFATYQYKISPLIVESLQKRPWVIASGLAMPYVITEATKQYNNISQKEFGEIKSNLRSFMKRSKSYAMLPWKDNKGNWGWVDVQYFMPWGNMMEAGLSASQGRLKDTASSTGIMSNPWLQLLQGSFGASKDSPPKDPFTNRDIWNQLDSPSEKMQKYVAWVYGIWMPGMITRNGAAHRTYKAIKGEKEYFGREPSLLEGLMRFGGVNVFHPTPEQAMIEKKKMRGESISDLYRILGNPGSTHEKKTDARKRFRNRQDEIFGREPKERKTPFQDLKELIGAK